VLAINTRLEVLVVLVKLSAKMKLSTALLASLTVTATVGFQPTFRGVSTNTYQSASKLFMSDEIKDYKKGLSKITGQGGAGNKVRGAVVSCRGLKVKSHFHVVVLNYGIFQNSPAQVVFSNSAEVHLRTMNASITSLI